MRRIRLSGGSLKASAPDMRVTTSCSSLLPDMSRKPTSIESRHSFPSNTRLQPVRNNAWMTSSDVPAALGNLSSDTLQAEKSQALRIEDSNSGDDDMPPTDHGINAWGYVGAGILVHIRFIYN